MVGGSEVSVQSGKAWPIRLRLHADMAWEWSDMALFGHTGLGRRARGFEGIIEYQTAGRER